jgi:hypothetical protein
MWKDLSEETRKRIEAAGSLPTSLATLDLNSPHHELFVQYFSDNCDDEEDRRKWECYWWMRSKDLASFTSVTDGSGRVRYRPRSEVMSETARQFQTAYAPLGATPIAWPAAIADWYTTRDQLDDEVEAAAEAVDATGLEPEDDKYQKSPEWQAWSTAVDKSRDWSVSNPMPVDAARKYCDDTVNGWFKAFGDEISRMQGQEMTYADLDEDYIASLNEQNLKDLAEGQEVKCLGYGTYVLIGQFPPGYERAVMSYDKAWYGTLTMKQKGGAFSPGKVTMTGCDGQDQEWFKTAFRRVSKKAITFA